MDASTQRLVSLLAVALPCTTASAGVMTYNDLADFQNATVALQVQLDDFEASPWFPVDVPLPQPIVSFGVAWTGVEDVGIHTGAGTVSGTNALVSRDIIPPDATDELMADLPGGATAAGAWLANGGAGNDVELVALDSGGTELGSVLAGIDQLGAGEFRFVGIVSTEEIDRLVIRSLQPTVPGDDLVLDDFYFGVVPEPTGLILLTLGAVAIGCRRRAQPNC